jgi:hypothetical protein
MRIAVWLVALFAVVFGVVGVFTPDSLTLRAVGAVALVGGLATPLFGVERHRPLTFAVLRRFSRTLEAGGQFGVYLIDLENRE